MAVSFIKFRFKAGCFALVVILLSCRCLYSMSLSHGSIGLAVITYRGIYSSYLFVFELFACWVFYMGSVNYSFFISK